MDGGLATSADQGKTWAKAATGITSAQPVELPDGRIATIANGHLATSKDSGKTWTQFGPNPPFKPAGVTYSVWTKTFYIWQWGCGGVVLPNAIASIGFDAAVP
jgi:hypothetical protein